MSFYNSQHKRVGIKPIFTALKRVKRGFSSASVTNALVAAALVLSFVSNDVSAARPLQAQATPTIGTIQTTNVYPSRVITSEWGGVEHVLSADVPADGLYQEFGRANSAYVLPPDRDPALREGAAPQQAEPTTELPEEGGATPPQAEMPADAPAPEEASSPEGSVAEEVPLSFWQGADGLVQTFAAWVSTRVGVVYAQEVPPAPPAEPEPAPPAPPAPAPEVGAETPPEAPIEVPSEEPLVTEVEPQPNPPLEGEPAPAPVESATSSDAVEAVPSVDAAPGEPERLSANRVSRTVTLGDFSMLPLAPGEFVKNVQLRASLAAKSGIASDGVPATITFTASSSAGSYTLGSVIVDGEVSNALNGGHFLFAFPYEDNLAFLKKAEVSVTFSGSLGALNAAFLDAVWLEIETETITKEDLKKRAQEDVVKKLKAPEAYELLSTERDFTRFENPVFNLRYETQRNRAVAALREFLGREKVQVEYVAIKHHASGEIGIVPEVTVTRDGLVSIVIPEAEREKFRPGVYEVELTVTEGGFEVVDSFEFQWGLLAINTDKTHYEVGESVSVYAGALTPNGNTLCDATLRLFVVAPSGALSETTVDPSGQCFGNNVTDTPDYLQVVSAGEPGLYELYLERLGETGEVISHTEMSFNVADRQALQIRRNGPTRIYPPAGYPMELTVVAHESFTGTLTERVPVDFAVTAPGARDTVVGSYRELSWDVSLNAGETLSVAYDFDAPDLSPFLYELGPARLEPRTATRTTRDSSSFDSGVAETAASSSDATTAAPLPESTRPGTGNGNGGGNGNGNQNASSTEVLAQLGETGAGNGTGAPSANGNGNGGGGRTGASVGDGSFTEHRQWQIASDATGNMILYWDDGASIPAGWSCLSCGSGTFFQRFAVGSSTYNLTGGAATHTHTANGSVLAATTAATESGAGTIEPTAHTHTYTPVISTPSNLPPYRQLRVIQYTASAGEPATIPAGAIGIFDVASSSLPAGWNRYAAQDGYYVRGENTPGTTGGSATHTHSVTGTTGAAAGTGTRVRGGGVQVAAGADNHTHTVSSSTPVVNHEPPYIEVVFAKLTTASAPPNSLITMWTEDVPAGWIDVSTSGAAPFNNRFVKGATSYGATGGAATHTHADMNGIVSSGPSATTLARQEAPLAGVSGTHTHNVNVTNFSTASNLPPYVTAVFGKRQGTDPVYTQRSSRWYVNTNAQTPTDPWPVGATDLLEREAIGTSTTPVAAGQEVRLRINLSVTNATSTAGSTFKLQYGAGGTCSAVSVWNDVGNTASSSVWRGFNNTSVTTGSTLTTTLLASSTVAATYEENGLSTSTPSNIVVGGFGEWDFVLEQNGALPGTHYCFRMVESDGTPLGTYAHYPQLFTNQAPELNELTTPFSNEKTASTTIRFTFVATDPESNDIHYEVEVDDDFAFGSPLEDRNTISNASLFNNVEVPADKAPFTSGQQMEFLPTSSFANGTTYWWRVRGQDPSGSNAWGEWSTPQSFTIDTALTASAWFQTTEEQFDQNNLVGVESLVTDAVALISGSTTGTMTSEAIVFAKGDRGTAWDSLVFADTETVGDVKYRLEYLTGASTWASVPDTDLAGNSTGFDASPVSLLALDVDTYHTLRIVATLTNSGGSPSIQSWGVNWGYRVETPTVASPFPNEKVGTTTPRFQFTTTDPQGDSLTYQISWSLTPDFTASTTRTSGIHAGFSNLDTGLDTDPFISGDAIQFVVQGADALTNNTTYWFRVRAKDTTGDNAYSFWTEPQSFTVDTAVTVSTWFQTTEEQFASNILSGAAPTTADGVTVATTATEALIVYGEGTASEPRYRQWDGSAWSGEDVLLDIGAPVRWAMTKAATTREEYIAVTVGTDADVNAQVFTTGSWGDLQEMTTNVGSVNARGADVAYETLSGDALVVYCDGDADPSYYVWNGTTWTSGGTINLGSTNNCEWIKLAADPLSDEIILMARDSVGTNAASYEVQVWNGSGWGNAATQGGARGAAYETMALEYEDGGGQALSVSGDGNPARFEYNSWSGTAWAGLTTAALPDNFMFGELVRDDGTDAMAFCYIDESVDIGVIRWTGAAWTGQTTLDADGNANTDRPVSCVYETTAGRDGNIMVAYSDTTDTRYRVWNGATWSAEANVSTITDTASMQLRRTGDGVILGVFFDDVSDRLDFSSWNGTSWSTLETLESNASVGTSPYGEPFMIAPRNPGKSGTTIVSPAIEFTDGVGPYWDSFSWNDTTPGTSDIRYSMQYYDGDSWEFIPDGDLAGNAAGFTTSPVDLSALDKNVYGTIRPYAALSCDGSNNCPTLNDWTVTWAEGITISGTLEEYNQTTAVTSGTVAVAVNGVLQVGKTGTVSAGSWSIDNVTVFTGDVVTVFVDGALDQDEAIGVTRYDGSGNISGMELYERHVSLGSADTGVALSNTQVGLYTATQDEDVFLGRTGSVVNLCAVAGCADVRLAILPAVTFTPGGQFLTHDLLNNGTLVATGTIQVSGSWDNNATTTLAGSSVVMTATSSTESIDTTGAVVGSFNNLTFGTTTGAATWNLTNTLDVNGALTVTRGTLARGTTAITVAGALTTGANGLWTGLGTTTFDGTSPATWSDQNATKQNVGRVVIDGTGKAVTLGSAVVAENITIGADDSFDLSTSNYTLTINGNFINQNTFFSRSGTVVLAATTPNRIVTAGGDAFYNLTVSGAGSTWSFTESTLQVNNNLTISAGTVTLPTATTTIAGSFLNTGGTFAHNNSVVNFTGSGSRSVTLSGSGFTNSLYDVRFAGTGTYTFTEATATTSRNFTVTAGTVVLPSSQLALGGSLLQSGGTITPGTGTVRVYSSSAAALTLTSALHSVTVAAAGPFTFTNASATLGGNLTVLTGSVTLPSGTLTLRGSLDNNGTLNPQTGTLLFAATATGQTVALGSSALYNATFNSATGGWTITEPATTTNATTLTAGTFTLGSGQTLAVGGNFANTMAPASTTWTGSRLALNGGTFSINGKTSAGDSYDSVRIAPSADVSVWNSSFTSVTTLVGGSLYSQDHGAVDGALNIYGTYERTTGTEHWSYATDFDGTALGGGSRAATVRFAAGATASFTGSTLAVVGTPAATTTILNQGSGTYTVSLANSTLNAQYYSFADLGSTGVTLGQNTTIAEMDDGAFTVAAAAGSALTVASSTIDANPGLQIFRTRFATTTAISAFNVTQTGGAPSSYWWFRNGSGNLYGEAFDSDTGNPGSVRFDDSLLVITVSGTVYSDAGVTPLTGGTCDGVTNVVRVVVEGGASYTGSCSNVDGSYSVGGVVVVGDPTVTVYLDGASGGQRATMVTKTPTADITDADLYANRVILRHQDVAPLTIADLNAYDAGNDADVRFVAATTTGNHSLTVLSGTELYVWSERQFAPGGTVTIAGNGALNSYDGSLFLAASSTFTGTGTTTYSIAGSLTKSAGASFAAASSTVLMTATTTGKAITGAGTVNLHNLSFAGAAGGWNLNVPLSLTGTMAVNAGTVTGTENITLSNGSLTGNGALSLGGGTVLIARTNTLGGTTPWTFANLTLGNGGVVGTTTLASAATTTVSGTLTIANAHFLNAGSGVWNLTGSGSVLVETGTLVEGASTFRFSGLGATVPSTGYYNLTLAAAAGTPTYTAAGLGIQVANTLTVGGGAAPAVFTLDTADTPITVLGSVAIASNGTLIGSNSAAFTLRGSWNNDGAFTASGGAVTWNGTGAATIAAGSSPFATLTLSGTGSVTLTEHATATVAMRLQSLSSFTLASGQTLAVGGQFTNAVGGAATTWTGSTLALYGGGTYLINPATTTDTYGTLRALSGTQVRTWNSSAATTQTAAGSSVYSMDHANVAGDLYVYGDYRKTSGTDHWSYGTDFDGTALGGSSRQVDVRFAAGATAYYTGTAGLSVQGSASASTTLANQGSGTYALLLGGTSSTTMRYYTVQDTVAAGITFTGSAVVQDLSYSTFTVSQNGASAITVGGTALNASPARNFTLNTFATSSGVSTAFNVTATGTSVSSWRFTNHSGAIDGEAFDSDPDGDPGYLVWDNSAASITISGRVYSDEGTTVSTHCDGTTPNVHVRVAGLTSYTTSCNAATGLYSVSGVTYSPNDAVIVYLDGESVGAAAVTADPVSNINNMDLYERRVIVRHEGTTPLSIDDMSVWDSSDDADIPFTAVNGSPDTLTVPANHKLIVWGSKTFTPAGNVTVTGNSTGTALDGTLELYTSAAFVAAGTQVHTIGGSLLLGTGASFTPGQSTTTFTSTFGSRTIDINNGSFHNVAFTGSGSWTISDSVLDVATFTQSAGSITFPTGTTTVSGSFVATGGSFTATGPFVFDGTGTHSLRFDDSSVGAVTISGSGSFTFADANATSTGSFLKTAGSATLPTGTLAVAGSFENRAGALTAGSGRISLTAAGAATLRAAGQDLGSVRLAGGGSFVMADTNLTLLGGLTLTSGSLTLATGTLAIGGSFNTTGGTFSNATGTVLFNSSDTGESILPGSSAFYNVVFASPTGGWTIGASATTTNNFTLTTASSFTLQSGATLAVGGVFQNAVGGSATTWTGSTLRLTSGGTYSVNTKTAGGDAYEALTIVNGTDVSAWNSRATTTNVTGEASLYSQDHGAVDGALNIYGEVTLASSTAYWSYARDFDGTALGGSSRAVTVRFAPNATTTVAGGGLEVFGAAGNPTAVTNQGSGTYALAVTGGSFAAEYYSFANLNARGLDISGSPAIGTLDNGSFTLAVNGGSLITLTAGALNVNASKVISDVGFATTSAITGFNVTLVGVTSNAWTFVDSFGNLDGEDFDVDGVSLCGSIRFDDSSCLITQQVHYRWRADDGGIGVPDSEWFNPAWDARQRIRIENTDAAPYTDAVVELTIPYDTDMQVDFDDLRFTDASGTTTLSHWVERYTASTEASVWVKVPTLPAEDIATIFMYYGNLSATSSASGVGTFAAVDDFEDGNITEYSGDTALFEVDGTYAFGGSFGLDNTGEENSRAVNGMARFDQTVSQGQMIRFMQYISTGTGDETCVTFGVQSPVTALDNYAVCLEQEGVDRVSIARDVKDTDTSGVVLASTTMTYTNGWYEVEVAWGTDDTIVASVYKDGALEAVASTTNGGTYTSGGYGFTYWFNYGGWDNFTARPLLATEPTVYFGAEQRDGGASWLEALNTPADGVELGDTIRLRTLLENSGLTRTNQEYILEYAERGASLSCEAVDPADYAAVPAQASCGTSPVCMTSSSFVTDGEVTTDLLLEARGTFTAGEYTEDPSNTADPITIAQDAYTELEYAITPTVNVVDQNLCFRVTNQGTELDTYLRVPALQLKFAPVISNVVLNGGLDVALLPGTTTRVYATATVTDLNGAGDLARATSTFYTSSSTASCSPNNNDCYQTTTAGQCSFQSCSGNSCVLSCYADFAFHANPTDANGTDWFAFFEVEDLAAEYDFDTSGPVDVLTLRALDVVESINYGALEAGQTTAATNATTTVLNLGNVGIDISLVGTDMTDGFSSTIPVSNQKLATSSFDYSACVTCANLSTSSVLVEADLGKPTVANPPVADVIYWGIAVPFGVSSSPHSGQNTFYAVDE